MPIAWTATDADNDALQVAIEFSDDGSTWSQIAVANGSGTLDVPIEQLAGSANARIRVWASDGFLSGTVTSNAFSVAAQAPRRSSSRRWMVRRISKVRPCRCWAAPSINRMVC